jgi:small nuclear ribonucleoprotein (snRNP)-like protein
MMLKVPVGSVRSIDMQLNAALEDVHSLLPVEVVVANEGSHAPLEIL